MSHSDCLHLWWTNSVEKYQFYSLHQNRDSQKIIRSAICNGFHQYLNTYISTTIHSVCSIEVPVKSLPIEKMIGLRNQYLGSFQTTIIPTVKKFMKCL